MRKYIYLGLLGVGRFLLLGLVSAAVACAREAAWRAHDQCNLKQITLATLKTADDHDGLMPFASVPASDYSPPHRLSLFVELLPNLERQPLYRSFDRTKPWDAPENAEAVRTRVQSFLCPASAGAMSSARLACASLPSSLDGAYHTSYVALSGVGLHSASLPVGDPACGAFGHNRQARYPKDFTDGVSQTIFFIETACDCGPWAAGGPATLRYVDPDVSTQLGDWAPFGRDHMARWGLVTSGTSYSTSLSLGDGSVRALYPGISARTLAAAATIAGAEILGEDW